MWDQQKMQSGVLPYGDRRYLHRFKVLVGLCYCSPRKLIQPLCQWGDLGKLLPPLQGASVPPL